MFDTMRIRLTHGCLAAAIVFTGAVCACLRGADSASRTGPARFLYVWAGSGNDTTKGVDVITVLDANPSSPKYGGVVAALTVDTAGKMPHHTEFSLPDKLPFFANDYSGDKSFLLDYTNPTSPRLAGEVARVPGGRKIHSFVRLPNGHVLASVQFGDAKVAGNPGMLAEFDENGRLVQAGSARDSAFPGAHIRTYAIATLPDIDRVVTTSSPMNMESTAHVVQVWRLSDLKLLKTLPTPQLAGDSSHMYPFEVRTLADGRSALVNSYYCGFFLLTDLSDDAKIERVFSMPLPKNVGCSVPVTIGKFIVMPVAYAHRFAILDISDPRHPREVASLATDTTFFPHWISADPGSDRLVFTDQGDGPPMVMVAHFDGTTGRLTLDEHFRDRGSSKPGVSYHRDRWPNGFSGMLMPHGALFVP
jgi:hypothetical protein